MKPDSADGAMDRVWRRYPTEIRCGNPACDHQVAWTSVGRPNRFCSPRCRSDFWNTREALKRDHANAVRLWTQVKEQGGDPDSIESLEAFLRWHLARYGVVGINSVRSTPREADPT